MNSLTVYYFTSLVVGLLMIGAATFLLLTLDHWSAQAARRSGDEGARLTRKWARGTGIGLLAGGLFAVAWSLQLVLSR